MKKVGLVVIHWNRSHKIPAENSLLHPMPWRRSVVQSGRLNTSWMEFQTKWRKGTGEEKLLVFLCKGKEGKK